MQHSKRMIVFLLLSVLTILLVACGSSAAAVAEPPPAVLESSGVEGINRVILTEHAAQRLGIETAAIVEEQIDGATMKVAPYAAVIYDINGGTWLYVNIAPLTFVRESITIDYIEEDKAILTDGPDVGTEVATVAVAELYGTDTGVGK